MTCSEPSRRGFWCLHLKTRFCSGTQEHFSLSFFCCHLFAFEIEPQTGNVCRFFIIRARDWKCQTDTLCWGLRAALTYCTSFILMIHINKLIQVFWMKWEQRLLPLSHWTKHCKQHVLTFLQTMALYLALWHCFCKIAKIYNVLLYGRCLVWFGLGNTPGVFRKRSQFRLKWWH